VWRSGQGESEMAKTRIVLADWNKKVLFDGYLNSGDARDFEFPIPIYHLRISKSHKEKTPTFLLLICTDKEHPKKKRI